MAGAGARGARGRQRETGRGRCVCLARCTARRAKANRQALGMGELVSMETGTQWPQLTWTRRGRESALGRRPPHPQMPGS